MLNRLTPAFILAILLRTAGISAAADAAPAADQAMFEKQVAPILAARCLECHAGESAKGGLDLSSRALATKGGKTGPALLAKDVLDSPLWQRVADNEMPPKKPLPAHEKAAIEAWLKAGGHWPEGSIDRFQFSSATRAGYDWWSFQPLKTNFGTKKDVDDFIGEKLAESNIKPNPQAAPRDLIRRLYFEMTGLPPTFEEVAAFERDPSPAHYKKIVDRLLASPRYGERWARHWLDVVRYGESTGFERNEPNHKIWPYRDWVIQALNADMPYDQFAKMQLAGDLLEPGMTGAAAAGYMVAGVHNTVVGVSERMRLLARQDELEENIGTLGQTFLGLTVQCARCHDHKFDPISSREYYSMISAIDGVQHGEKSIVSPALTTKIQSLQGRLKSQYAELAALEELARSRQKSGTLPAAEPTGLPRPYAMWLFDENPRDSVGDLHGELLGSARVENGALVLDGKTGYFRTPTLKKTLIFKTLEAWVQANDLDQRGGGVISLESGDGAIFDAIVFAELEPRRWMAGSDGFSRTIAFQGAEEKELKNRPVHIAITWQPDGTVTCYRDGLPYGLPYKTIPTRFPANNTHILIGLRHLQPGGNKHFKGKILRAAIYDRPLKPEEIMKSSTRQTGFLGESEYARLLKPDELQRRKALKTEAEATQKSLSMATTSAAEKIYTVSSTSKPGPMKIHIRGDVTQFGPVVAPAGLKSVGAGPDWGLTAESTDQERRQKLANWVASPKNPLFSRVIVNRLWHYHFGTGLVETPNDFGFNGGRPSHPELLDFLAGQLQSSGFRLKSLHRLILNSNAYKRSSATSAANIAIDAQNRLLWRHSPTRAEGETLRDTMLAAAGRLQMGMGGPGFIDLEIIDKKNGTTYYEPIDPPGPEFQRRTVYRFSPRGGRGTLLDGFDCPDPANTAPRRNVTTTPLQALSLLHGEFPVRVAHELANTLENSDSRSREMQVKAAWRKILQRDPSPEELSSAAQLAERHGLWAVCLGLFNFNEFVVIP